MKAILKTCCDCGETKPLGQFSRCGRNGSTWHPYCRKCKGGRMRASKAAVFVAAGAQLDPLGMALQSWCLRP